MINGNGQVIQQINRNGQVIQQQQINENGQVMQQHQYLYPKQHQQINQQVLQQFITSIKDAIRNKSIDTSSVMKLIVICIEIMENMQTENIDKKQYVILAINEIAKGDDLIFGTSDDTISPQVLVSLIVMIDRDLISEVIDIIIDIKIKNKK
jgi:hypothetical protein